MIVIDRINKQCISLLITIVRILHILALLQLLH